MPRDYDVRKAFERIEDELIDSMMRNLGRHLAEEDAEGFNWPQWQVEQLKYLEQYREKNMKKFGPQFARINARMQDMIEKAKDKGAYEEEKKILDTLRKNPLLAEQLTSRRDSARIMGASFFKINEDKLQALLKATQADMTKAEHAVLRRCNDQYRKIIFDAQVYANTGAGTVRQAVDMATKDFLANGINSIVYSNGARHTISDYADMVIRTAERRAYLMGEGEKRKEWGEELVIVNKRGGHPCPQCAAWIGKVLIDDVYSGGHPDGSHTLLSTAMQAGFLHPRCKDGFTTYFPGISSAPDPDATKKELKEAVLAEKEEVRRQYAERQAEKYGRMAEYSLDPGNKRKYEARANGWNKLKGARFRTGGQTSKEYANSKRPLANFVATPSEKVVDLLRRDSRGWVETLTDFEIKAIKKYTYNSGDRRPNRFFERLNRALRKGVKSGSYFDKYATAISSGIKKNRVQRDVIAYRGIDIDPTEGYSVNDILFFDQFTSTSVIETQAMKGEYKLVIYVKKGSDAAYIEELSHFKRQRELLLDIRCGYRLLSRKGKVIELEVI